MPKNYKKFRKDILQIYKELNLSLDSNEEDRTISNAIKLVDEYSIAPSATYNFPAASGFYGDRELKISPSYYPFKISYVALGGNADDILLKQLNPVPRIYKFTSGRSHIRYMVIRMGLKTDIGKNPILLYPKYFSWKLFAFLNSLFGSPVIPQKTNFTELDKKYVTSFRENQKWFLSSIDYDIVEKLAGLELPKTAGSIFQFSKNHATFSIVPGSIGINKIKAILEILYKFSKNIEKKYPNT